MRKIELRAVKPDQFNLFNQIRNDGMRPHLKKLHIWGSEEEQTAYNRTQFNPDTLLCIYVDNEVAGFINMRAADYETYSLGLFCIAEKFRNQGVGTAVLQIVLKTSYPVFLNVLHDSPAIHLYKRFGFEYSHSSKISDYYKKLPCGQEYDL